VSIGKLSCPLLKEVCWREWSLCFELEDALVECGLALPPLDWGRREDCPLGEWAERDHGGRSYAILHETALDEISGLDWMTTCLVQFAALHRQQGAEFDDERRSLIMNRPRRVALSLLHWIVQNASSSLSPSASSLHSPTRLSIRRTSATLSLTNEVKLNIYRAIITSDLFAEYLESPHVSQWTLNMSLYFDEHLTVLAREVLGTCHEVVLIYRSSVPAAQLLSSPSSLHEIFPVLAMASGVVEVMLSRVRCFLAQDLDHERIGSKIRSWMTPSWEWIFKDLLSLREAVVRCQRERLCRTELELINLSESIVTFAELARQFSGREGEEAREQDSLVN
jgi:hypothetical protein